MSYSSNALRLSDGVVVDASTGRVTTREARVPAAPSSPTALTAPASTAATNSTPYGYSQAQADAIVTAVRAIVTILQNAGLAS